MIAKIQGNSKISGEVSVGGAKNAALPILAASILSSEKVVLNKIPDLLDVKQIISMMRTAGSNILFDKNTVIVRNQNSKGEIENFESEIRASILLLGPLAVKTGHAILPYPGGCSIGERPIDIHIDGLKALGFSVIQREDSVEAFRGSKIKNVEINMHFPSVGATEHLMITASMLDGTHTTLINCAKEPEIVDLQNFLRSMGAKIEGAGTDIMEISGVKKLGSSEYTIICDRIEAGTYIIATLAGRGNLKVNGAVNELMNVIKELKKWGAGLEIDGDSVIVKPSDIKAFKVSTGPYPQFPTDLQPQSALLACYTEGVSEITENIFEKRFLYVDGLRRMGAKIDINGQTAKIERRNLHGAMMSGSNLRETATLLFAAAIADGPSEISNFEKVLRGYEKIDEKLEMMGIKVEIIEAKTEAS